jgi:SAM-dependent methyltransferase
MQVPQPSISPLHLDVPATLENFDEAGYLAANPDVARAVSPVNPTKWRSGRQHFLTIGRTEGRRIRQLAALEAHRAEKMAHVEPRLLDWLPHTRRGPKYDFLTEDLRQDAGIEDTPNVSSNSYDPSVLELIASCPDGLLLDCGAGKRDLYFPNVVNYDVVDYDTTDVIGVGEVLPFKDDSFDGVISIAVLEHVRDPFRCAAEIVRVLKPGARLICGVPFLQPYHGYPHHYYNMTHEGLRTLFERQLVIDDQRVLDSMLPVWALTWIVQDWSDALPPDVRQSFLDLRLGDLLGDPTRHLDAAWVRQLPGSKNLELACATVLWAHKPE